LTEKQSDNPLLDSTNMKKPTRRSNDKPSNENHLMTSKANNLTLTKTRPSRENVLKPLNSQPTWGNQSKMPIEKAPKRKQVIYFSIFSSPQLPGVGEGGLKTRIMG
jgi:hypothetical protein